MLTTQYGLEDGTIGLLVALLLFLYQTLDGTDGKQARNTKSGSPIGEVIDHGVDALVTSWYVVIVMTLMTSFRWDETFAFVFLAGSQSAFVISQLTLLHVGKQTVGECDSQESQVVVQSLLVLHAIAPAVTETLWTTLDRPLATIADHDVTGKTVLIVLVVGNLVRVCLEACYDVTTSYAVSSSSATSTTSAATPSRRTRARSKTPTRRSARVREKKKNAESTADVSQTLRTFYKQMFVIVAFNVLSYQCKSTLSVMQWVVLSAFAIADISNRVLVARITRAATQWVPWGLVVMTIAVVRPGRNGVALTQHAADALNGRLGTLVGEDGAVRIDEGWICPMLMACIHLRFIVSRVVLYARLLGVSVLTVKTKASA